ncbi:MAG TPA: hypothetical protein VGL53_24245 [Bryobacteraceae bacterium]|jgi:hypothetical protein
MAIEFMKPVAAVDDTSKSLTKKEKRAMQARINGAKSKGPITPDGLAKSSKNAIRHGLTANEHTLLEAEFADEYEEVYNAFIADLRPATKAELRLVEKIANIDWRAERLVMMETCVLNLETDLNGMQILERFERIDGIGLVVEAWKHSMSASHCLELLRRYMGTLQNEFNALLSNYFKLEARRLARARGGTNLDEAWGPPYERPRFETHLVSKIEAAAALAAAPEEAPETQDQLVVVDAPSAEIPSAGANEPAPPAVPPAQPKSTASLRSIRNEPSIRKRVMLLKRPAA